MIDAGLINIIAEEEREQYNQDLYEYLPEEWRKNIDSILAMCNSLAGLLKKVAEENEEAINLYREFVATTGVSDIFLKKICEETDIDSVITEKIVELSPVYDPIVIVEGNDICYGTPREIVQALGKAYETLGEKVIYISSDGIDVLQDVINKRGDKIKFFVGAQSILLNATFFQNMKNVPKVQIIMDNPLFLDNFYEGYNDSYFTFIQDYKYVEMVKKYIGFNNADYLPFAGERGSGCYGNKKYNLSFVGSYKAPIKDFSGWSDIKIEYYQYMIEHPTASYDEGLKAFYDEKSICLSDSDIQRMMWEYREVCYEVAHFFRHKIIETVLSSNITIDVFGEAWKKYEGSGKENLIVHEELSSKEALDVYSESKVSLNIMSWHKAGVTERVANIMMSDAVCLSEMTDAIKKEFVVTGDKQQLVTFEIDKIEELPGIIRELLKDEIRCKKIVQNAHQECEMNHTWECRAIEIYNTLLNHLT